VQQPPAEESGGSSKSVNAREISHQNLIKVKKLKKQLNGNVQIQAIPDDEHELMMENTNLIHSFEEIDWVDPFPEPKEDSDDEYEKSMTDLPSRRKRKANKTRLVDMSMQYEFVYDESKFNDYTPPAMVYIPDKNILYKMMKVCSSVDDPL
jgi:hypothetical protein